jgi:hypothetical protein
MGHHHEKLISQGVQTPQFCASDISMHGPRHRSADLYFWAGLLIKRLKVNVSLQMVNSHLKLEVVKYYYFTGKFSFDFEAGD